MVKRPLVGDNKAIAWPNVVHATQIATRELASWPTESKATIVYENVLILEIDLIQKFAKNEANVIAVYHHHLFKNGKSAIREFV